VFRRVFLSLLLITTSGCARSGETQPAGRLGPIHGIIDRLTATDCRARQIAPGSTWIDYDHGGGRVQLGEDGKVHRIPESLGTAASVQRDNLKE
jgi:hypothetical protein